MNNKSERISYYKLLTLLLSILPVFFSITEANGNPVADFDGDGKSDISVFRPSDGFWYVAKSSGGFSVVKWGLGTDALVPGDYDGDGKTDLAVYRYGEFQPTSFSNFYYVLKSSDNGFLVKQWGGGGGGFVADILTLPADYDGDGKTDFGVYESQDYFPAPGRFKILRSSDSAGSFINWGVNADQRVPADYDGDGKADIAVFRSGGIFNTPADQVNNWYILNSSTGTMRVVRFGTANDRLVPADYDGDGKADIAVYRPSNGFWYRLNSRDNSFSAIQFGLSDDKPTPADYDGDGRTDLAVFRPSTGVWYLQRSTAGFAAQQFGLNGDVPIPNTFVR